MTIFGRQLTHFDWYRIAGYGFALALLLTPDTLAALGLPNTWAKEIATIAGRVVLVGTLISSVLRNPSPPWGASYASIPRGTVPVVTAAPGTGGVSAAHVDPSTVSQAVAVAIPRT